MKKLRSKKGFTLMEMLIVVAIIGILVAIAVPVFKTQLDKAEAAVDTANVRSAKSMAVAQYLLDSETGAEIYYYVIDSQKNLTAYSGTGVPASGKYIQVNIADGGSVSSAELKTVPAS